MHRNSIGGQAATAGDAARADAGADVVGVLAGLESAVDAVAGLDLGMVDPGALAGLVRALDRCHARLGAARMGAIGALEARRAYAGDGHGSAKAWLADRLRVDPRAAAGQVRLARQLGSLPALADAYAAGDLSARHARTVADAVGRAAPGTDTAGLEADLVAAARRMHPGQLARHARARHIADTPADAAAVEAAAFTHRAAHYTPRADGGATFTLQLTPADHELHRTALQARITTDPPDTPTGQRRRWTQRLYDAAIDIARRDLADPDRPTRHGTPVTATVIIPAHTLLTDPDHTGSDSGGGEGGQGAGWLGFAGPVTATTARRLACNAQLSRVLLNPDGQVLDVGRTQRAATPAQHRALHAIWHGCARCGAPPSFCEAHHIDWWDRNHGPTDLDNLLPLCWACHSAVHHTGLTITRHPDHTITFTTPHGTHHHRAPP